MDTVPSLTNSVIFDNWTNAFHHHNHEHKDILDVNDEFKQELFAYTSFQVLFLILGVTGNILIIFIYKTKLQKKREGRSFIIFLAAVDLLHCIVSSALVLVKNLNPLTFPDKWTCKILIYGTNWLFILSLLVLLLICIERYWKVCRPLSSRFTKREKFVMSISIIIFAGTIPIPRIIYFEVRSIHLGNLTGNVCGPNMELTGADLVIPGILYFNFILSGMVIVILVILYGLVGKVIYNHKKRNSRSFSLASIEGNVKHGFINGNQENCIGRRVEDEGNNDENSCSNILNCSAQRTKIINRATIMFMIVTLVTVLSYIPLWIFVLMDVLDPTRWFVMPDTELHFFYFLRALSVAGYLSNPVIYAYYDRKFRSVCFKYICVCCLKTDVKCKFTSDDP